MAAVIAIHRYTGAGETESAAISGGSTRASTSDNHYTTETTNPIPIPTAGTKYSFWVVTRLKCTTDPTGTVNNIKWYTTGSSNFGTGVAVEVATASAYDYDSAGTVGDTGTNLTVANYGNGTTDLNAEPSNAYAYTSGSPLSVSGSHSSGAPVAFGDRVVYQIEVISTASAGTLTDDTYTWQYDET